MSDVSLASSLSRRCIGPCRRELPLTREYFYFRERAGQFEGRCRACQIAKTLAKRRTRRTQDGLEGGVMETRRKVKTAFVEMDPGGIRERELYRRLDVIEKSFRDLPLVKKEAAVERWKAKFLQASSEERTVKTEIE